ncbi:protein of unknown function [Streptomyces sp. KY70]|nr:protein of unknown function [Streptomyces sp. KY70]
MAPGGFPAGDRNRASSRDPGSAQSGEDERVRLPLLLPLLLFPHGFRVPLGARVGFAQRLRGRRRSPGEQVAHHAYVPEGGGPLQGGPALLHLADVRSTPQEQIHHLRMPVLRGGRRQHQRRKVQPALRAGGGSGIEKELRHGDVPVHRRQTQRRHLAVRARPLPRVRTGIEEHPDNVHVPGMHGEVQRGTPVSTEAVHLDTITQQPRHRSDVPVPCGEREPIRHVHSRPSPTEDGSVLPVDRNPAGPRLGLVELPGVAVVAQGPQAYVPGLAVVLVAGRPGVDAELVDADLGGAPVVGVDADGRGHAVLLRVARPDDVAVVLETARDAVGGGRSEAGVRRSRLSRRRCGEGGVRRGLQGGDIGPGCRSEAFDDLHVRRHLHFLQILHRFVGRCGHRRESRERKC